MDLIPSFSRINALYQTFVRVANYFSPDRDGYCIFEAAFLRKACESYFFQKEKGAVALII